jgi:hypothetical protein
MQEMITNPLKMWNFSKIWEHHNESKFHLGRNQGQIGIREYLPSFGAESIPSSLLPNNKTIKIYRTTILPLILYECDTWSPTSREQHRLRVFENGVLRGIFGPKREDVT